MCVLAAPNNTFNNAKIMKQVIAGSTDPAMEVPINGEAMTISTNLFEGKIEVHLKGLPTSQKRVFDGKKRFFQVMCQVMQHLCDLCTACAGVRCAASLPCFYGVLCCQGQQINSSLPLPSSQGRFKRAVDADGLCMGQEFVKAGNVPALVSELVLTAAAKVFSNSTQVDIYAMLPYFMNPILAACQLVNVSKPGSEPKLAEATEDMRLFAPELVDKHGACMSMRF